MTELALKQVFYSVAERQILQDINLSVAAGEFVVLLGGNGAGKSTLMKCALGLLPVTAGTVQLGGAAVGQLNPIQRARLTSYLPQKRPVAWPISVKDVVALGRYAYGTRPGRLGTEDQAAVSRAIEQCQLSAFVNRQVPTLSGGEATRVHCARTFAAEAPLLLADEPTTALDPRHQLEIMALLRSYVNESRGALVVAHEPALAARFADRLVWMKEGAIIEDGPPQRTLTSDLLREVYGVQALVTGHEGRPLVDIQGPV